MPKTIGIIGGMTPESTTVYYKHIISNYEKQFEDFGFPEIIIYSVSFQRIFDWANNDNWNAIANHMTEIIHKLNQAGASFALIAANTPHHVFDIVQSRSPLPLISIIDSTIEQIQRKGLKKVGLLGTRFTMQKTFFKDGLQGNEITTLVPSAEEQENIHRIIFDELARGIISESSHNLFLHIIEKLEEKGAEGIILGCTELPLLLREKDCDLPFFDTARIHADKAFHIAME